jgi:ribosomal protein L15
MPAIREQLKKLPKMRGRGVHGLISIETKPSIVNVAKLELVFATGDSVNPKILTDRGVIKASKSVKILGDGDLTKKLTHSGCLVSGSAVRR